MNRDYVRRIVYVEDPGRRAVWLSVGTEHGGMVMVR